MGFFKKLGRLLSPIPQSNTGRELWIQVRCKRCGETIRARVDLWNELSWSDADSAEIQDSSSPAFTCRKVVMGSGNCYQQIEVLLGFNSNRQLISQRVRGGEFVES